tara:strand:- start:79 stop:843 length:765 start_codon:yes stop_codon:yes gene_type:complete
MALLTEEVLKEIKLYDFDSVSLPIFNKKFDDKIIGRVIKLSNIRNLSKNYSHEKGFDLPIDESWCNAIKEQNSSKYKFLKYHVSRQFRFTMADSCHINGIRTKDGMKYWTETEVNNLITSIKEAIDYYKCEIMPIILSEKLEIKFNEFDIANKDQVTRNVISLSKNSILNGIGKCFSYEGGFILPLSILMKQAIRTQNKDNADYLQYHNSRDFRFVQENNKISGLRTKDSMRWWTNEETDEFIRLINLSIESIH